MILHLSHLQCRSRAKRVSLAKLFIIFYNKEHVSRGLIKILCLDFILSWRNGDYYEELWTQ